MDAKQLSTKQKNIICRSLVDISWHLPMVKAVSFMMLTVMNIWIFSRDSS